MEIEKAIEILKEQYTTVSKCLSIKEATEQNTAINLAISALEKQIPKKLNKFTYPKNIVYMYCPECDEGIDENNLFCNRCGQKLDWLEVEDEH